LVSALYLTISDQASAFRALDAIDQAYKQYFPIHQVAELQGLERIYRTPEGMSNYMDSRLRSRAAVLGTLLRDAARPVATALTPEVRAHLPYYSFPTTTTPWTGMVGHTKETGEFMGRVANGGGRKVGYSESGMIYAPEQRRKGLGKEATFALIVHAWLFKNLQFSVGKAPVTYFTATVSPDNRITSGLAAKFGAEVLESELNPYDKSSQRRLYGIPADRIDELLGRLIPNPEEQITINDQAPADFFAAQQRE
jgi:RimJ/RimL family protein N-acetyltransferase